MKLKIWLVKYNGTGSTAHIENGDEDDILVAGGISTTPKKACLAAAKALRDAAERFELLAIEAEPYHQTTHRRINAAKRKTPNAELSGATLAERPTPTPS